MPVIMMSGHGTIDTAVEATKYGAAAFLEKPITLQKLLRAVEQALVRPGARPAAPAAVASPQPVGRFEPVPPGPAYASDPVGGYPVASLPPSHLGVAPHGPQQNAGGAVV